MQLSLWNFVKYNVAGGGESARYGVEPWSFYLRNGALNLGLALPLALAYPCLALLQGAGRAGSRLDWRVVTAAAPLAVWLPAISVLPHKEERFLYVVYPQVRGYRCTLALLALQLVLSALVLQGTWCGGAHVLHHFATLRDCAISSVHDRPLRSRHSCGGRSHALTLEQH